MSRRPPKLQLPGGRVPSHAPKPGSCQGGPGAQERGLAFSFRCACSKGSGAGPAHLRYAGAAHSGETCLSRSPSFGTPKPESNAAGVWQGTSDAPLTQLGRDQLRRLQARFERVPFDMVLTSDLGRARETAQRAGAGGRSMAGGASCISAPGEGLTRDEIAVRDPEAVAALGSGEDIAFGGGERTSEMMARLTLGLRGSGDTSPRR